MPLLASSILLFYVGIGFAYYFVFPVMFEFFTHTTPKGVAMMTDINNYLDFVVTMFFCFGLAFEVPVAVVLLVLMGLVRVEQLQKSRGYVLIGIFILAALLTPPDAISQCSLAIPMYFLFEGGILMARILVRQNAAVTLRPRPSRRRRLRALRAAVCVVQTRAHCPPPRKQGRTHEPDCRDRHRAPG